MTNPSSSAASPAKNWCFTLNNPTPSEAQSLSTLHENPLVSYLIYQLEEGAESTPHFQGYVQLSSKKRFKGVKELLGPRVHLSKALGSATQNKEYCSKEPRLEETQEYGTMIGAGKRSDIEKFVEDMKTDVLTEAEVFDKHPAMLAKYPRFVSLTQRLLRERSVADPALIPRPGWQTELLTYVAGAVDPRQVRWYHDPVGNTGKSLFTRRFRVGGERAFIVTGGKHADIYHAYGRQPVVFFDWPRSGEESFPYQVLETFKNGYFLSTKYESTPVHFTPPHVIVFANFSPDRSKLSEDRWDVHNIHPPYA